MKLFVGNLNYHTTEKQLHGLFSEFGVVTSVSIINDKFTNRSRGFGFVEMEERASGEKAVARLNNTTFDSQSLVVNEAKPRTENNNNRRY
ncbi:RNA recognition motif domain-containing protein [Polluticoccus soli]|uniref:RNA recognition motif domain-containing protein n=1 Tax=Polluticoccus soli TaxID=3034150 RepID=UPI0023E0DE81|nr:RNA-binding protein [Flavipsychrobacter sp. JY13-12]